MSNEVLKKCAEDLLKIASEIEKDAESVTIFACDKCNHTATLSEINNSRRKAASELKNVKVSPVSVNDKVVCPRCNDGIMAYIPTDESKSYYINASEVNEDTTLDYDNL